MNVPDRIEYEPDTGLWHPDDAGMVDEIVIRAATVHLEMLGHDAAYMNLSTPGRWVHATLYVRPTTRRQQTRILRDHQNRLVDCLHGVLPWSGSMWSIPWWSRPGAAVEEWRYACRQARAVLVVRVDEDDEIQLGTNVPAAVAATPQHDQED